MKKMQKLWMKVYWKMKQSITEKILKKMKKKWELWMKMKQKMM